jgi:hypothetical protein
MTTAAAVWLTRAPNSATRSPSRRAAAAGLLPAGERRAVDNDDGGGSAKHRPAGAGRWQRRLEIARLLLLLLRLLWMGIEGRGLLLWVVRGGRDLRLINMRAWAMSAWHGQCQVAAGWQTGPDLPGLNPGIIAAKIHSPCQGLRAIIKQQAQRRGHSWAMLLTACALRAICSPAPLATRPCTHHWASRGPSWIRLRWRGVCVGWRGGARNRGVVRLLVLLLVRRVRSARHLRGLLASTHGLFSFFWCLGASLRVEHTGWAVLDGQNNAAARSGYADQCLVSSFYGSYAKVAP